MVLAESGTLAYDDPVSLTHTGGLPEYQDVIDTASGMPSNADALSLLGEMAASAFPPGERFEYSNPGYDMLAPPVKGGIRDGIREFHA